MQLTTNRGKTFEAVWAWGPVGPRRRLILSIRDERALSQISADFEGTEHMTVIDSNVGEAEYRGYTRLVRVERMDSGNVEIAMEQGEQHVSD